MILRLSEPPDQPSFGVRRLKEDARGEIFHQGFAGFIALKKTASACGLMSFEKTSKRWLETGKHRETNSLFLSHFEHFSDPSTRRTNV